MSDLTIADSAGQKGRHMTDDERERRIRDCGDRMLACMREWDATGCFDARGEAEVWRMRMEEAIKGRSAEFTRRREQQLGLI